MLNEGFARDVWSCFSCLGCGSCLSCSAWRSLRRPTYNEIPQLKTAERARAARGRVPKTRKPSLAGSRLCMLLLFCVGCGPSSSCNALRSLRKRRMVLLLLPRLRLLLVLQCLAFSASPASRSMIARFLYAYLRQIPRVGIF